MKLALVGYGKMGRMLDSLAAEHGFEVVARIDLGDSLDLARGADVAIEFSTPEVAVPNLLGLAERGVRTVCGTTGWFGDLPQVREAVEKAGGAVVYSPNFSIGVNVFLRIAAETARLMKDQASYGAWAWEIHHAAKKDAPSGTLLKIVEEMRASGYDRAIDISSNRVGAVPGTHEIGFDSAADTITLRHTARSREGFARGALKAAQWLCAHPDQRGTFEFRDIIFKG
ncbi:MAG: dihydrodipicolinate reductase C-terminal domain-containing protein [Bryobacteraceae bacterium]